VDNSDKITGSWWRGKLTSKAALHTRVHTHSTKIYICFKNVHSDWRSECTPSGVNVFERGIILPSHSEVSLAVTKLCWMQQCAISMQYRGIVVKSVKRRKETINYNSMLTKLFNNNDCTFQANVASFITRITGKLRNNIMRLHTHLILLQHYESTFAKHVLKLIIKCDVNNCLKLVLLLKLCTSGLVYPPPCSHECAVQILLAVLNSVLGYSKCSIK